MAQLEFTQTYEPKLRRDLHELANHIWLGQPVDGEKAGNFRAVYLMFNLANISAGTTFAVEHPLGEVPLGYEIIGTPTTHIIPLSPGTNADGTLTAWSKTRLYLKAPSDTNKIVAIRVWGTDAGG